MSLVELLAQTIRQAPSAPMRETFIAPKMLPVCCVCRLIRDETGSSPDRERWVTLWTYRTTHGVNPAISLSLIPTVWHVSGRPRRRRGSTSVRSEHHHDPGRRLSGHRLLSSRPDRRSPSNTGPGEGAAQPAWCILSALRGIIGPQLHDVPGK
jgi:hypothetical protein